MNRRTFFQGLVAALASIPVVGKLFASDASARPLGHPTRDAIDRARREHSEAVQSIIDKTIDDARLVAGEDLEAGDRVSIGADGKVYSVIRYKPPAIGNRIRRGNCGHVERKGSYRDVRRRARDSEDVPEWCIDKRTVTTVREYRRRMVRPVL